MEENIFNKIRELCCQLNTLTIDELRENGIDAIMLHCIGTNLTGVQYAKGDLHSVLTMLGMAISCVSKNSKIPLRVLMKMIYETETEIKEEGDKE